MALSILEYFENGAAREDREATMPLDTPEGKYTFCEDDRERIKSRSMLPTDALRYIEALEAIANAAFDYWKLPNLHQPGSKEKKAADVLYDALSVVNFLVEEE